MVSGSTLKSSELLGFDMCHGLRVTPVFVLGYWVFRSKNLILQFFKVTQFMRPKHQLSNDAVRVSENENAGIKY